MAELDRELRDIFEGIGKDVSALRKALAGTNKSILENTQNNKAHAASQKVLLSMLKSHQKNLKERGELTKELNDELDDQIKAVEKSTKATNKAGSTSTTFVGVVIKAIKFLGKFIMGAAQIGAQFGKTSSQIKGFSDAVEAGFDNIPYLGAAMKKLAPELDDNVQLFRGLALSGASFGSSITKLRMAAFDAGMPLMQFQELIQNNSTALARMFGSVDQGVVHLVALGKGLRKFQMDELAKFGITMDETNEFLTTYAEIERARGQSEGMTSARLLAGTQAYTKNLVLLSKLTGQSVTELDKQQRAMAADGVFQAKLAQMDEKQAERVRKALALLPAGAQQAAKEIIGLGAPISDTARGLEAISGGQFGDMLKSLMSGAETDLVNVSNTIKQLGTMMVKGGNDFASAALAGNSMWGDVLNVGSEMAGVATTREEIDKQLAAQGKDNIDNMVKMTSALDNTTVQLQRLGTIILEESLFAKDSKLGLLLEKYVEDDASMSKKLVGQTKKLFKWWQGRTDGGESGLGGSQDTDLDMDEMAFNSKKYQHGTYGSTGKIFENFGSGTPVTLHGSEAVVPEGSSFGRALSIFEKMAESKKDTETSLPPKADVEKIQVLKEDQSVLKNSLAELVKINESNRKVADHLNRLIMIGAMTEKNTKDAKNNLANLSGTLV